MGNHRQKSALKRSREACIAGQTVSTPKGVSKDQMFNAVFCEDLKQSLHKASASNMIKAAVTGKFPEYHQGDLSRKHSKAVIALMKAEGLIKEHSQCNHPQTDQRKK